MQNHVKYLENPSQGRKEQPIGDYIDQLPSDASVPSHNEIRIVDS